MILALTFAAMSGMLVGLNRQINGRLGLSTSPMFASFTNHLVGFAILTLVGAVVGGLLSGGALNSPWYAYLGGPIGVIFVAASSWLIPRIGAVQTTLLMISGQMLSGVVLDIARDAPGSLWARLLGVALIMTGILMTRKRAR